MPEFSEIEWVTFLSDYPDAHLLQTSAWGKLKSEFGWDVVYISSDVNSNINRVGAQILFRKLPIGASVAYIPKGPVGLAVEKDWSRLNDFWSLVDDLSRRRNAVFLKVEPDFYEILDNNRLQGVDIAQLGFRSSMQAIQPMRTLMVDLTGDEDQILTRMKQKTRYNIRLALKKGVVVRASGDLETFYQLMTVTGQRDRFGFHSLEYYQRAYDLFHPRSECELLVAEYKGEPLAGLMVFAHGKRAWYLYGASSSDHRERMPTYLLQWEAIRWARSHGCDSYDLWGVPDVDEEILEANFTNQSGGLWGVYRFKRGFGGDLMRSAGPWDRVYRPIIYAFYQLWVRYRARDDLS